jgi:hypothetical protein
MRLLCVFVEDGHEVRKTFAEFFRGARKRGDMDRNMADVEQLLEDLYNDRSRR